MSRQLYDEIGKQLVQHGWNEWLDGMMRRYETKEHDIGWARVQRYAGVPIPPNSWPDLCDPLTASAIGFQVARSGIEITYIDDEWVVNRGGQMLLPETYELSGPLGIVIAQTWIALQQAIQKEQHESGHR